MTNEQIISLARSIIRDRRRVVEAMNKVEDECASSLLVAYNLLRGHQAEVGIPDGPEHDGILDRCKAIAEMLGAHHAKLRIEHPDGPQYLDAFIPSDRPEIRRRIRDSL
jgi:hypothetical protein